MDLSVAYDGSTRPQTRELQPLERDILSRIIHDILNTCTYGYARSVRVFASEVELLHNMAEVLTPRED